MNPITLQTIGFLVVALLFGGPVVWKYVQPLLAKVKQIAPPSDAAPPADVRAQGIAAVCELDRIFELRGMPLEERRRLFLLALTNVSFPQR